MFQTQLTTAQKNANSSDSLQQEIKLSSDSVFL